DPVAWCLHTQARRAATSLPAGSLFSKALIAGGRYLYFCPFEENMMGNMYTNKAPAWLAAVAGIAFFAVPPLSSAQSGKGTMVAMAQAPSPETSTTQGHTGAQSG